MKKIILGLVISFLSVTAFCQTKISIEDAAKHYEERVTICSKVYGTKALEKVTIIFKKEQYGRSISLKINNL